MKPLWESVYTHTSEGKSRSDWLLNKANRHDRKAFKSALDKQSPSAIAFDRREGFSLVTRLRRAVGGRLLGPNLERSETLVKRETWGRSCHFVETNKSPESKSLRRRKRVLKPLRLIYRLWGCCFKGTCVAPESTLALLFLFFFYCL